MRPSLKNIAVTSLVLAAVLPGAPIAHTTGGASSRASAPPATSTKRSDTDRSRPANGTWGAYLRTPLRSSWIIGTGARTPTLCGAGCRIRAVSLGAAMRRSS